MKSFSMGGAHICADIFEALDVPFEMAEEAKRLVDLNLNYSDEAVLVSDGENAVYAQDACEIAKNRLDVFAEILSDIFKEIEDDAPSYMSVYLTGEGVASMRGAKKYLSEQLGKNIEIITPKLPGFVKPEDSSKASLLVMADNLSKFDFGAFIKSYSTEVKMIDFEKFGWTPSDETSSEEEETVQEEVVEEPVEEVQHEESHEEYQPVSQKKPGKANIVVVGVGGGGNNAVNNMIRAGIKSASFVVMNTDMQALNMSLVPPHCKIQLGANMTGGLGAGSDPEIGRKAAEESRERIKAALKDIDLLFITAGMGGGTGTGAAPVIAEIAKSMNILTVAVVTKPFNFEGAQRMKNAEEGIKNLKNFVDTLLVIPNQKLIEVLDKNISFKRAFEIADDVLRQGVQGVSDVIANPELINLDFADVRTILSNKGLAHMGIGYGKGEKRVIEAVRGAVFSPLLETDIEGATGIIVNITGGDDMLLGEVTEACDIVKQVVDPSANIILGTAFVPDKKDIEITIIATGFVDRNLAPARSSAPQPQKSFATALSQAAATEEEKEEEQPAQQEQPVFNQDIFANRPVFGQMQRPVATPEPVQPVVQPVVQPAPAPQPVMQESEIQSSRIDVTKNKCRHSFVD